MLARDLVQEKPVQVKPYRGTQLDEALKKFPFERMGAESDQDYILRILPDLKRRNSRLLAEIIFGLPHSAWQSLDCLQYKHIQRMSPTVLQKYTLMELEQSCRRQ